MGGPARRADAQRSRGLASDDDALAVGAGALAALEAQAGVVAREAVHMGERLSAPLLVGDQQHAELGEQLGAGGERPRHAEGQDHTALHVHRPGAVETITIAPQRPVRRVVDDRIDVAEQHHPVLTGSGHPGHEVMRAAPVELDTRSSSACAGRSARAHRQCLVGAGHVPGGR